jgi:hypothetical protein
MSEKKVSLNAGEVKYLLSRAIRFGHRNPKVSVETLIDSYVAENLASVMARGENPLFGLMPML